MKKDETKMDDVKLRAKSGRTIAVRNLRPGDWLSFEPSGDHATAVVAQNWPSLNRTEIWFQGNPDDSCVVIYPRALAALYTYAGRGKKRHWLRFLPSFIGRHICPYSKPTK